MWLIILFVLAGVVNHLAFSSHGPGLLIPLVKKFQKKESPTSIAFKEHREAEEHRRFHHFVAFPQPPEALQPTCFICHSNLPHNKTKKIRAMLNMHTTYLACETCHLKNDGSKPSYTNGTLRWKKTPKGPFFGTAYDPRNRRTGNGSTIFQKSLPSIKKTGS